jgi:SAM-dependent methyltransferase
MTVEWPGYCPVCDARTTFVQHGDWLRDQLLCGRCGSNPRFRALTYVLSLVRPDWSRQRIWEIAPAGPASRRLATTCQAYTGTQYWPDVPPGDHRDGVRCEDIESPTFEDASFDIIVACDVLEHIFDVDRAFASVARVLADDGLMLWTVPRQQDLEVSRPRARRHSDSIEHLLPAEYHGDPVNADGVLVSYDWGRDLVARVESASKLSTTVFEIESRSLGILGEFVEVFVSSARVDGPVRAVPPAATSDAGLDNDDVRRRLAEVEGRLAAAICQTYETRQLANARRNEVDAIRESTSWRVTKPLRWVSGFVASKVPRSVRR